VLILARHCEYRGVSGQSFLGLDVMFLFFFDMASLQVVYPGFIAINFSAWRQQLWQWQPWHIVVH